MSKFLGFAFIRSLARKPVAAPVPALVALNDKQIGHVSGGGGLPNGGWATR